MDCGATTIKYLLFIFNFIFFISGIILLTIGAIIKADQPKYATLSGSDVFGISILLIVVGCLVMAITFFGCCGAIRESRCMLITYAVLLSIIFIMELAAGIAAFVYRDDLTNVATKELNETLYKYDKTNSSAPTTKNWDDMQKELKCCGAYNYTDWGNILKNYSVPISCCVNITMGCGDKQLTQVTTTIYHEGCVDKIVHQISSKAIIIGGIGIGIAFIQILGITFACCLASAIKSNR